MKALERADLINGSLVFFLAIQSATTLFSAAHRAFGLPLATSRGLLGVEISWLFIGLMVVVTILAAVLTGRYVVQTSGPGATTKHAIGAKLWFVGYGVVTALLSIHHLNTFTSVFRP